MIDSTLIMKDAGLVAASAAATVGGEAMVANVGTSLVKADMVFDVSAIEIASGDELYVLGIEGSDTEDFSTGSPVIEELAVLHLGSHLVLSGNQDTQPGRYILPFRNEKNGTVFPYLRVYTTVAGTVATGINYTAHIQAG